MAWYHTQPSTVTFHPLATRAIGKKSTNHCRLDGSLCSSLLKINLVADLLNLQLSHISSINHSFTGKETDCNKEHKKPQKASQGNVKQ
jgi:hypothetical protein